LILSAGDDKFVKVFDSETLNLVADFENDAAMMSAQFHPDGTSIATGSLDGRVELIDMRSKLLMQAYPLAHSDQVNSVAFHNSGRFLISTSSDSSLKIYDLRMG